jgi:hypothetical protein
MSRAGIAVLALALLASCQVPRRRPAHRTIAGSLPRAPLRRSGR